MLPSAASDHYRAQQEITATVLLAARRIWGTRPPKDFDSWFAANVDRLVAVAASGQARAVRGAEAYVADALDELGTPVAADLIPSTTPLVGVASDGRPLDSLMYGSVITAKSKIAAAENVDQQTLSKAWESGLNALMLRMQVQVADASRAATSLSIVTRRNVGYARMLNPPSCARCALLAGKFYRWNQGFQRHPGCDCRHIPSSEDAAGDLHTDPKDYFDSLTEDLQNKIFTKAGAEAIRDGADISQVVNARRGMAVASGRAQLTNAYGRNLLTTTEGVTKRGLAGKALNARGRTAATTPRLMPEAIYEIAEDRDDALRLLRMNGYMGDRTPSPLGRATSTDPRRRTTRKPEPVGGGRVPPRPPREDVLVSGDDDGELLARQLDDDFADWAKGLSERQRSAIAQWQRADDRFFQRIQQVLRTGADDLEAAQVAGPVLESIDAGRLARDVVTWRGIRNTNTLFGVPNQRLAELTGQEVQANGLLAVSTSRSLAVEEFTKPSFGGGPALLRVSIQSGTPAAWVKLVGEPDMQYQRELLLSDGHLMRVREVSYTGDLPIVDVEVI
ncbi:VG15 protein [Rhodococcus marinonascens]|uniref:VG15 protein n=1 Tax=Rhodococcus marinonascens TaxID=38311 RepID=UPI000932A84E|nr:hypothetical protein [Rhodococcus marinonascens]